MIPGVVAGFPAREVTAPISASNPTYWTAVSGAPPSASKSGNQVTLGGEFLAASNVGNNAAAVLVGTLPVGFRPPATVQLSVYISYVNGGGSGSTVTVNPNGQISLSSPPSPEFNGGRLSLMNGFSV